jgi:serine/threonine protein kinase
MKTAPPLARLPTAAAAPGDDAAAQRARLGAPAAGAIGGAGPGIGDTGDSHVVVANGQLRVGYDGISVVNSGDSAILPPIVRIEDLAEERVLDRTPERNVTLYRRADVPERKERYAVKELLIKNQRDTIHVVAAEVGAAFTNRSEFTVGLHNAYLRGDKLILIMEYMDGRSLADLLLSVQELHERMPEDCAAYVTHRLLLALRCMHEGKGGHARVASSSTPAQLALTPREGRRSPSAACGSGSGGVPPHLHERSTSGQLSARGGGSEGGKRVVHRDIKPSNILLNSSGAVKLADFGVAGSTDSIGLATFVGTVTYMSPERIHGKGYNTPSDIWSVGTVVAEMLLGYHPFMENHAAHSGQAAPAPGSAAGASTQAADGEAGAPVASGGGSNLGCGGPFFELFERVTRCTNFQLGPGFSADANDFIRSCLQQSPEDRPTAFALLRHPWIARFGDGVTIVDRAAATSSTSAVGTPQSGTAVGQASRSASSFLGPSMSSSASNFAVAVTPASPLAGTDRGAPAASDAPVSAFEARSPASGAALPSQGSGGDTAAAAAPVPPLLPTGFAHYVVDVRRRAREREAAERAAKKALRAEKESIRGQAAAATVKA